MTHCVCCDRLLSDYEATLRHGVTFQFLDTCKSCLKDVKGLFPIVERKDLISEAELDDDTEVEDYENPSDLVDFDEPMMDSGDSRDYL